MTILAWVLMGLLISVALVSLIVVVVLVSFIGGLINALIKGFSK